MSAPIHFFVEGEPKAQPRAKAFARKFGTKWMARVYDPGTAEGWKSMIAIAAKAHRPIYPLKGPIELRIVFNMLRPVSHYHVGKKAGQVRSSAPALHTNRPDLDNLEKAVMDALTQICMWHDDSQVCVKRTSKEYAIARSIGAAITIIPLQFPPEPNAPGPAVRSSIPEPSAPVADALAPAMAESLTPPNTPTKL